MTESRILVDVHAHSLGSSVNGRFLGKPVWGFADQMVISAANFLSMILLARHLGPAHYGAFVVTYTVLQIANSAQGALFTQPHNVLGATQAGLAYRHYTTATALIQVVFALVVGLVILAVGLLLSIKGHDRSVLIIVLAPASVAWQLQEFVRRVLYTGSEPARAFIVDSVTYGLQVTVFIVAWKTDLLTAVAAVIIIGLSFCVGTIVGILYIRHLIDRRVPKLEVASSTQRNWEFGRWLLAGSTMSWLSSQIFPVLTAGLVGTVAAGGLRAAQTLLGPTHIFLKTFEAMAPSRAAQAFQSSGRKGVVRSLQQSAKPIGAFMLGYCALIAYFAETITAVILGAEYESFAWLVRIYALYYLLTTARTFLSVGLKSMGLSSAIFYAQALGAGFVMTAGLILVQFMGLTGAAIGLVLSAAITVYGLAIRFRQHLITPRTVTTPRRANEREAL